jgi:hypothetical protein
MRDDWSEDWRGPVLGTSACTGDSWDAPSALGNRADWGPGVEIPGCHGMRLGLVFIRGWLAGRDWFPLGKTRAARPTARVSGYRIKLIAR